MNAPFEGAMLLFLFSLSNVLQAYAIDRTRKAIKSLMKLRPEKALARRDGGTVVLSLGELVVGDVLVVRPRESIALDGIIIEGTSTIDQASLTGESMPVSKKVGDPVFAGTINQTGGLEVRVTKLAKAPPSKSWCAWSKKHKLRRPTRSVFSTVPSSSTLWASSF